MSQSEYSVSYNPANGREIGRSALHTPDDLKAMITNARIAAESWSAGSIHERVEQIRKIRHYIVGNANEIAQIIAQDNGKTMVDAIATEVIPAAMAVSYYCDNAANFLRDKHLSGGNIALCFKRSKAVRVPYGVVGIISPWNYPYAIAFSEVIMGLLAGNAVILKTASETQMVGLKLKESVEAAGLPEHVFQYVNMPGRIAGDAFLETEVDKLFFTGSVDVGKYLMKKASETLTPLCLELGGNDAMIVCEDADLQRAAAGAVWAGFQSAGQSCGGVERIYVQEKAADRFLNIMKSKVESLRVGEYTNHSSDMGVMTTERQIKTVAEHIDEAVKRGAEIFAQSKGPNDTNFKNILPATVLINVDHEMKVMQDETFGPVVGVMRFTDIDDAVRLANDSYLGLTGSVWSRDTRKAERIARRIKAGAITINDHLMSHGLAETSWGGFKQSGIGRTHGESGFNEFTQLQMIVHDIIPGAKKQMWWHPFSKSVYEGLRGLLYFLYGSSISQRISGTLKLLKIVPRMFSSKRESL